MKKIFTAICIFALIFSMATPVFADEHQTVILVQEIDLDDGVTATSKIMELSNLWATDKTYAHTMTLKREGVVIGEVTIMATFRYNGTTVSVVTKSVTQTDTYNGWNYKQNSFTSSNGTVTLDAKLTKLLIYNVPFTMSIVCDKDGNITLS